ncbi:MAG: ABC transporter ATP-binding protein [Candidatus Glassbacteria bacterium RIFCSPLOWO2_12_FULL_58_11]|uniref:ABC transporter ATP-binding protein n=1 Tax=Candidatus Glassbacteria bacterium RIFCSPLOWO2_12_FULL_58_11 TaxID=1817867 RepID=A0A1F5YTS6_9BACT|nr:MAG: ABC transporter ATP-binding protein [Candidatus Glassbacteria bacterium RIFCSPLOWO2_12_FULL_58_11]
MSEAVIEIEDFTYASGAKRILNQVSFRVGEADYLSIIGPNGAGKTTLLKCLNRILPGGEGTIKIRGRRLESYSQRALARLVSYVPQLDGRALPFSVDEFVSMGRYPYLNPFSPLSAEDRRVVREILERTGTLDFAGRRLDTLSGGERQKVFIAAALAQGAEILLLDEPTSFLDYRHQVEIHRLLRELNREHGKTVLAVTHDINNAVLACNRVLALKEGRKVFEGEARELVRKETLEGIYETAFLFVENPYSALPLVRPAESGS